MSRCIHVCGHCENNVTCPYFCDQPQQYRAYGSIGEMLRDIEREKDEKIKNGNNAILPRNGHQFHT